MKKILFICTANQCRSPMAAILFEEQIRRAGLSDSWLVESAGTWAADGLPASKNVQLVMEKRGLDVSQHRSRIVTSELLRDADLVLVMEHGHKEALHVEFPDTAHKVYLLSELVLGTPAEDIHDPIGAPIEEYEAAAEDIDQRLRSGFENILKIAQNPAIDDTASTQ